MAGKESSSFPFSARLEKRWNGREREEKRISLRNFVSFIFFMAFNFPLASYEKNES